MFIRKLASATLLGTIFSPNFHRALALALKLAEEADFFHLSRHERVEVRRDLRAHRHEVINARQDGVEVRLRLTHAVLGTGAEKLASRIDTALIAAL